MESERYQCKQNLQVNDTCAVKKYIKLPCNLALAYRKQSTTDTPSCD